ncbi:molybdate ABC transporter substrate-binding protein [Puniceibacterium sp. IMCC21224]|uniref:molybdate ABC transporter substrate-binding protein n=1 Tax=Puniceibacterium sp. IMCC21224 TaxID=1618204 RepID=UPI00064D79DD|nr:molybdate ABC transporter substrate-binding protein [Puniceibacterium sp. IMCC21224]KMK68113.1 molybdenum ABC transporter, periplasmic molybdate-binding protein [Puniceibacterium sp. IMCC21224]
MRISGAIAVMVLMVEPVQAAEITVFAAASLGDALSEATALWQQETGHQVILTPAGSSALARQIAAGAPADVFVSANTDWMDWLDAQGGIDAATRRVLMGNALVLIGAGEGEIPPVEIAPDYDITAELATSDRLAMALVNAVPAGIYGKAALQWLGQWEALEPRVAQADNVRAALALVALGETPLGIVYATDAVAETRVHVVGTFPAESHAPILYSAAVTAEASEGDVAAEFLDWLAGTGARAILRDHGFVLPPE